MSDLGITVLEIAHDSNIPTGDLISFAMRKGLEFDALYSDNELLLSRGEMSEFRDCYVLNAMRAKYSLTLYER